MDKPIVKLWHNKLSLFDRLTIRRVLQLYETDKVKILTLFKLESSWDCIGCNRFLTYYEDQNICNKCSITLCFKCSGENHEIEWYCQSCK